MGNLGVGENIIILVSLKKKKAKTELVTNPLNALLASMSAWLREGDLSLTFVTP